MAHISDPRAPERLRAAYLRFLVNRRRQIAEDRRPAIAPISTPVRKPAKGRRSFDGGPGVLGRMQSLFNLSYEELKRQRDEAAQKAEEAGHLRHEAIERERD